LVVWENYRGVQEEALKNGRVEITEMLLPAPPYHLPTPP